MSNWKRPIAATILLLSLIGCGKTISSCPPLVDYTAEEQNQAADELEAGLARGDGMLPRMIGDYSLLRDQIRACR